ncbi:MAG: hypothetical protein ABIR79_13395 [Candidatus Binatia bacterium]
MSTPDATAPPTAPAARRPPAWLEDLDATDLSLRLTLLTLLLRPVGSPGIRVAILALATFGLTVPSRLRHPALWATLAALTSIRVLLDWSLADNHAYLLAYWCLAITLALLARDTGACLALNARLLIGWAFALAVLWKLVLSPDYLDGRFFRVTLLTDERFADFTRLAGGLATDELGALRAFVRGDLSIDAGAPGAFPERLLAVARLATFWTVGVEAAVAVAWLSPLGRGLSFARDVLLLAFCVTTYAVATIAGFGWLLLSMGIAQCDPHRGRTRVGYLAAFGVVLAYDGLPFMRWGLDWLR